MRVSPLPGDARSFVRTAVDACFFFESTREI